MKLRHLKRRQTARAVEWARRPPMVCVFRLTEITGFEPVDGGYVKFVHSDPMYDILHPYEIVTPERSAEARGEDA